MILPQFVRLQDLALLLLRLMVAIIFISSGWAHISHAAERAKSIEMSKGFTLYLGMVELAGGMGLIFGVLTKIAALGLVLIMLGAIYKKIAVWHTGFWGEKSSGWHYELMLIIMNFVIITTDGGAYVLMK